MTYCCDRRREDQGGPQAAHQAEHDQEVPVFAAHTEEEVCCYEKDRSSKNEPSRPFCVEDRSNLNAAEEGEERVDSENPANCRVSLLSKLMG